MRNVQGVGLVAECLSSAGLMKGKLQGVEAETAPDTRLRQFPASMAAAAEEAGPQLQLGEVTGFA